VRQPAPPVPPPTPPERAEGIRPGRRPILVGAIFAALLAVLGGGALALTQLGGTETTADNAVAPKVAPPEPSDSGLPSAPPPPAGPTRIPTDGDVRTLLETYADRYGAEDADGLSELFADDAVRVSDGKVEDRAQAIATYREQFAQLNNPTYALSEPQIDREPGSATATGRYRITSSSGTVTGDIQFELVDSDGHLVIERLAIQSD
jgi:hypothetical protein